MWFLEIQFSEKEWKPTGIFPQCKQKCVFWTFYFSKKSVKSMSISEMCKFVSFNSLSLYMGERRKNRCLQLYIGYNLLPHRYEATQKIIHTQNPLSMGKRLYFLSAAGATQTKNLHRQVCPIDNGTWVCIWADKPKITNHMSGDIWLLILRLIILFKTIFPIKNEGQTQTLYNKVIMNTLVFFISSWYNNLWVKWIY